MPIDPALRQEITEAMVHPTQAPPIQVQPQQQAAPMARLTVLLSITHEAQPHRALPLRIPVMVPMAPKPAYQVAMDLDANSGWRYPTGAPNGPAVIVVQNMNGEGMPGQIHVSLDQVPYPEQCQVIRGGGVPYMAEVQDAAKLRIRSTSHTQHCMITYFKI